MTCQRCPFTRWTWHQLYCLVLSSSTCPRLFSGTRLILWQQDVLLDSLVPGKYIGTRHSAYVTDITGVTGTVTPVNLHLADVTNDRSVDVMEVSLPARRIPCLTEYYQPFLINERVIVNTMSILGAALEADLRNLLICYGETPDSADSPNSEDFFALIPSFSSLQASHDFP
jgi:hypothetical protein